MYLFLVSCSYLHSINCYLRFCFFPSPEFIVFCDGVTYDDRDRKQLFQISTLVTTSQFRNSVACLSLQQPLSLSFDEVCPVNKKIPIFEYAYLVQSTIVQLKQQRHLNFQFDGYRSPKIFYDSVACFAFFRFLLVTRFFMQCLFLFRISYLATYRACLEARRQDNTVHVLKRE